MSELLNSIDARTRLAGTNKLEILLFALGLDNRTGRRETFGINVFKVREVMRTPPITAAPDMPAAVKGMVSLRGALVPVVDLADYIGMQPDSPREIMIVTEYNGKTQGFLVESVDTILRLDWAQMRVPPQMLTSNLGGLVTAVTELPDGCLVMMLDVERVLAETDKVDDAMIFSGISSLGRDDLTILFADDSSVARGQIERTLEVLGVRHISAVNGRAAWDELQRIATLAETSGKHVKDYVQLVLTDVEMPEMDGYLLTKNIKADSRFSGIPVIMHSSLSSMSNQQLGRSVGVDEYVPKFEPHRLAETLGRLLLNRTRHNPAKLNGRPGSHERQPGICGRRHERPFVDGKRRCAHQARRLEPDGDPAVLTGDARDFRHQRVQGARGQPDSRDNPGTQHAGWCGRPDQPARQCHPGAVAVQGHEPRRTRPPPGVAR
jgi:two-component system chemotaxis response regulator CheV